ncbi:MAG TPA: M14 family zinc carboxypeptidase [Pyrinomonadaceae bacterium]|nr:M14 family zinc carboxypeptidase [Pyrinomonadaceae bacterium]
MRKRSLTLSVLLFVAFSIQSDAIIGSAASQSKTIPTPHDVLGFTPGDDRKLASWAKIVEYFQKLDAASERVKFEEIGKSTMGVPFVYATISAPENLGRLDEFKEIQRQLADPRLLGSQTNPALADRKARLLIARGKTIVLITCGIHSTEVGSTLSSTLIAHRLASSNEPEIQEMLRNTIVVLVPSLNPDGVDIVKNWYDKTLGTPYEGTEPPELYHKYVGHDNNRDWYAFTQVETQLTVDKLHNAWHPQIVHDIHQQGAFGSRLFLPPYMQPVEPNVPKRIVEGYTELGNWMAAEMRKAGFRGITTNSTYDAWTPARAYSHYHGGVRILSETASARIASPRTVTFDELRSRESTEGSNSAGYDPKTESANFGPVWRGGEWKLGDITNYMTTGAFTLLKHAAQNRERWLQRFYEIGKEAVRPRKEGELIGFKISAGRLADVLVRGGVEVQPIPVKSVIISGNRRVPAEVPGGEVFVPMAQPYGAHAKALLENQVYPNLRSESGSPIPPYDVTAHTLPLLFGLPAEPVYEPIRTTGTVKADLVGGSEVQKTSPNRPRSDSRTGLYKSYVPSMDEGWTRWVFEDWEVPYGTLLDNEIRKDGLRRKYDTIIIPDQPQAAILNGHRKGAMPEEYTGGLGEKGVKALREFVEQGGTLICLNRASNFAIEQFKLPVRDVVAGLPRTDFYVPGSILRIELNPNHPMAKEMPKESIAWVENSPVFEITENFFSVPWGKVVAWYPHDRDPLISGWLLGGHRLKGKAALVEVGLGKGRIILFGFRPQYRGQSLATYPLLFNAIAQR